jgi:hypothetical protein
MQRSSPLVLDNGAPLPAGALVRIGDANFQ